MPSRSPAAAGLAALALASLPACTEPSSQDAGPVPSASLLTLDVPDTGHVVEHLANRTGPWTATVGAAGDAGPIDISLSCVGNGDVEVTHGVASRDRATAAGPCDATISHNRDESAPPGPITVSVRPDGDQRWSLLVVRGMELAG